MKEKSNKTASLKGIRPVAKPRSMGEVAYDALKEAILKGTLTQGQKLIETRLSLQMKVSRVPIREAIKKNRNPIERKTALRPSMWFLSRSI